MAPKWFLRGDSPLFHSTAHRKGLVLSIELARQLQHVLRNDISLNFARPTVDGRRSRVIERSEKIDFDSCNVVCAFEHGIFGTRLYQQIGQALPRLHRPDLE